MNDFDKRFEERSKEFDRDFRNMEKVALFWGALSIIISMALIGFGIWAVVMLFRFFGVI
jgi:hypothetical protein